MIRAVFFDAAGTLFEPAERVGKTYSRFARREGVTADSDALERGFRSAFAAAPPLAFPPGAAARQTLERDWWRRLVFDAFARAASTAPSPALERAFDAVFDHFAAAGAWRVFPDVLPTLRLLGERGLRLAVVSNFDSRLHSLLEQLGLRDHFHSVVLSSECGHAKPDARIFSAALAATASEGRFSLHVGDSQDRDVRGARAAGLAALRVDRGGVSDDDTIASLAEVPDRLD